MHSLKCFEICDDTSQPMANETREGKKGRVAVTKTRDDDAETDAKESKEDMKEERKHAIKKKPMQFVAKAQS